MDKSKSKQVLTKKITDNCKKLSIFPLKKLALELFEFLEQFMIDTFLIKLTQFEETRSKVKIFISLEILIIKFILKLEVSHVFLPFNINEQNIKK